LTDAIIKNPYAVLILDEIEKAHPDLFNILLQVMDHATLTDNNGRKADFRNVVLIMTTNAGAFEMAAGAIGFGNPEGRGTDSKNVIEKTFAPEFRNRLDAWIQFNHLTPQVIEQVVEKLVGELEGQLNSKKVSLDLTPGARHWLAEHGYDRKNGARPMGRLIDRELRRKLADEILFGRLQDGGTVKVDADSAGLNIEPQPLAVPAQKEAKESQPA
jgi:ATP-dependent Clp protease ATP-binding subunit ClpA